MPAIDVLLDLGLLDVFDIGFPCTQHLHFFGISIKSGNSMTCFCESEG